MLAGCTTLDAGHRAKHAEAFQRAIERATADTLPPDEPLGLEECVAIALERNLSVKTAAVARRTALLERRVAFANFLPALDIGYKYARWDKQPENSLAGLFSIPMQDQSIDTWTWDFQMPIFAPATWFLYSIHKHGAHIGEWAEEYARQMILLQVTGLYFHCLALDQAQKTLHSQVQAAEKLADEVAAFRDEGLAMPWEAEQAETLLLARRVALHQAQRSLHQSKADLLVAMDLSPLADVTLAEGTSIHPPDAPLEDLILTALLHRPQLHMADRKVAIARDKAKIAIVDFLPSLAGFAQRTSTSNSYTTYPDYWISGVAGVVSLFDGLANVNEYRVARAERQQAYLEREEACLTIMLEVVKAHLALESALEQAALAEKARTVAAGKYEQISAQFDEGLVRVSERLGALAEKQEAEANVLRADYQQQVSTASLLNVMGTGYAGYTAFSEMPLAEVKHDDETS